MNETSMSMRSEDSYLLFELCVHLRLMDCTGKQVSFGQSRSPDGLRSQPVSSSSQHEDSASRQKAQEAAPRADATLSAYRSQLLLFRVLNKWHTMLVGQGRPGQRFKSPPLSFTLLRPFSNDHRPRYCASTLDASALIDGRNSLARACPESTASSAIQTRY
jgi:hypothetical protein